MRSGYKKLRPYIRQIDIRNSEGKTDNLLGVSTRKVFINSIANTVGTDFTKYKVVKRQQFTYVPDTSRRGDKIGIAMLDTHNEALVSQAYTVFEITDHGELEPEYLMMWFRRPEFDRYARFKSHGSVREIFDWDEMCDVELPIPTIHKQHEIVREYNTIVKRIKLNEQLNQKLEETAQALYKRWFVDFEFPSKEQFVFSFSGYEEFGEIPNSWKVKKLKDISVKIGSGATPKGGKGSYQITGIPLIRSMNIFDFNFEHGNLAFLNTVQAEKLSNAAVEKNDVLINITGVSVARCCAVPKSVIPARVNQHVAIIRPKNESKFTHFLMCSLCSSDYKNRLLGISEGGSTRQALTKTDLEECLILVPDKQTLSNFEQIISSLFAYKNCIIEENQLLKQSLILLLSSIVKNQSPEHNKDVA